MNRKIRTFILSGPGGAGKTTLVQQLFRKRFIKEHFIRSISFTTRAKRPGEKEGRDYFFISKREFLILKKKGFFLETQSVLNDYYGSAKYFYKRALAQKKDLILCIDVKGGMYLKKYARIGRIITIFISAPSQGELLKRLRKRVEKKVLITKRLALAKKELQCADYFDYLIVNQTVKKSIAVLETILFAEQFRRA